MNRETFTEVMQTAMDYYNKDLEPEVLKIYFEELGGMERRDLEDKIRKHINTMKSFPQVAHLKTFQSNENISRKPRHDEHPEWRKHWEGAERLMRAKLDGGDVDDQQTYLFPLAPLVEAAHKASLNHEDVYDDDEQNERARRSAAYGVLNQLIANRF